MSLSQLLKIPSVRAFLMRGEIFDVLEDICKKYNLPQERSEEFLDLCDAVINGELPLEHVPDLVTQAFGVSEEVAKRIAADVLGNRLLPLEQFLPGVEAGIVAWGGHIGDYPTERLENNHEVKEIGLKEVLENLQLSLSEVLVKRLIFLLQQFAEGEKTEASLKTYFTRSLNIGGLGLKPEQAETLLAATLPLAKTLLDEPKAQPAGVASAGQSGKPEARPEPVSVPEIAPNHELAAEVPVVSHPIPPVPPMPRAPAAKPVAKPAPATPRKTPELEVDVNELKLPAKKAAAARKITAVTQDAFASALVLATENAAPILKKKKISEKVFADLATKAIRGVRDIYQTRDIVERDWELQGDDLATLMQAITAGVDAYQAAPMPDKPKAEKAQAAAAHEEGEDKLDARFSKLTAATAHEQIAPAKAQLTVGSTSLMTPEGQRKMVDVVSTSRLAGPIEQLGNMTPTEFRRLSSSASEAAQKVEDLLSALESTSYEERVKGVLAWRDSPMNQLYLKIAEEALSQGLALPEMSSRRRAAGQDSLSPAEIKALALLNAQIRF